MAETRKLDVGKALDKLRGAETPKTRMTQLDEKMGALEEEMQKVGAMGRRLDRGHKAAPTVSGAQDTNAKRITTAKIVWAVIGAAIAILILAWMFWLF